MNLWLREEGLHSVFKTICKGRAGHRKLGYLSLLVHKTGLMQRNDLR